MKFGELFCEAKFPDGVVNILSGFANTGKAIVNHPDIDKISFTGIKNNLKISKNISV